jgi:hypothetical protein
MSDPTAEKVATTTTMTLTLPQLGEAERGLQTRSGAAHDPTQNTQAQLSAEKEQVDEDEEWLENPAHPRNWSSAKKWINMAIVSRSLPRPFPIHRSS